MLLYLECMFAQNCWQALQLTDHSYIGDTLVHSVEVSHPVT